MPPIVNDRVAWSVVVVAANSALQAEDFYTFLVTTCQTTADAHFRKPPLTPGTYLLKMCGNRHL